MRPEISKDFVMFLSPGTFIHEKTTRKIDGWNVNKAKRMAKSITERHGATPFGFYFTTKARKSDELDSKVIKTSKKYYLGGMVKSLADVKAENNPNNAILISNMESNGYGQIIQNNNSYLITQPFNEGDTVLEWQPK